MKLKKIIEIYDKNRTIPEYSSTEFPLGVISFKPSVKNINDFLETYFFEITQQIRKKEDEKQYKDYLIRYITSLIQKCDDKKIILNIPYPYIPAELMPIPLHGLGSRLEGKNMLVNGNLGDYAFMSSRGCFAEINGSVGDSFAYAAKDCSFKINKGNVGKNPLRNAYNCKLELIKTD